ncbi:unannotated protein [freshwater metagenome]|uniref:Unannotated protein n=1 Tax=freshwater metagenome TaxID=449393 RepID=A0A6J7G325_9ZZZZ|nr:peptidoglycan DD-metalloendopeptidase family protein [Actinomycetota bacterium]MSY78119.1 peptidoglycan DD-metalloendopeptidase family protein [Actinomycetota bacterium]MTA63400.1 peptidoglycan DD-metalloendopeptidase family protein [Actinomycetota bacterium]
MPDQSGMHPPQRSGPPATLSLHRNRYGTPRQNHHSSRKIAALALVAVSFVALSCAAAPGARNSSRLGSATTTSVLPAGGDAGNQLIVKPIVFPVSGGASYSDTFGAPRSGGRTHEGQDLITSKGTPLVAAVSGKITRVRHDLSGLSGNSLTITADDGWSYVYIHLNNDSPGTDDASNLFQYAFAPGMALNKRVVAGELVGFLGDSGNAEETVAHLHFEIRQPGGTVLNAFASLRAATAAPVIPRSW